MRKVKNEKVHEWKVGILQKQMKRQAPDHDASKDSFSPSASSFHGRETTYYEHQNDVEPEECSKVFTDSQTREVAPKIYESDESIHLKQGETDPEDVAALIASEMNSLTLEQRKAIYDDVHGVTNHREQETPDVTANLLRDFHDAVRKIRYKPEYEKAAFLNPDYVLDRNIVLMFLRAEDYNTKRAARRIVNHYKHKMELFGIDKLARPITFDDLSQDDKDAALTGAYQRLYLPDQSGRSVIMCFPHLFAFRNAVNQVRLMVSPSIVVACAHFLIMNQFFLHHFA